MFFLKHGVYTGVLRNVYSLRTVQSHLSNTRTAHAHTHRHGSLLLRFFFWPVFTATLTIFLTVERRYLPPQLNSSLVTQVSRSETIVVALLSTPTRYGGPSL